MNYANKYIKIKDGDHLESVINTTGMKMTDQHLCTLKRHLEYGLVIVFDENFDEDNNDWGFDYSPLLEETLLLEELKLEENEIFIPMPEASPAPPFKIRNANHPAVRQWLKDMGYGFRSAPILDILTHNLDFSFGIVRDDECFYAVCGEGYLEQEEQFDRYPVPELTLNLAVTSWSLPDPVDQAKLDHMKKIEELEQKLAELKEME